MHLTSARDYLIRELDCVASDPALAWEIDQDAAHALEVLKRKTLVIADAASGLRVLKASDIIGIDPRPADQILAYTRRIVAFSLADHYRHIGEPLAHRELPSLVLGQLSEVSKKLQASQPASNFRPTARTIRWRKSFYMPATGLANARSSSSVPPNCFHLCNRKACIRREGSVPLTYFRLATSRRAFWKAA